MFSILFVGQMGATPGLANPMYDDLGAAKFGAGHIQSDMGGGIYEDISVHQ